MTVQHDAFQAIVWWSLIYTQNKDSYQFRVCGSRVEITNVLVQKMSAFSRFTLSSLFRVDALPVAPHGGTWMSHGDVVFVLFVDGSGGGRSVVHVERRESW